MTDEEVAKQIIVPLQLDTCNCGHHQALAAAEERAERYRKALEEIAHEANGEKITDEGGFWVIERIARAALEEKI